jgi:hypothetical protein
MRFVHAPPEVSGDQRASYFWELLAAALESNRHVHGDYEIASYPVPMSHARTIAEMEAGGQGASISSCPVPILISKPACCRSVFPSTRVAGLPAVSDHA